jgi:hypothetical protein
MNLIARKLLSTLPLVIVFGLLSVVAVAAQTVGTATPSQAVAALVGPLAGQAGQTGCNALTGQLADCPITARLRARLANPTPGVETGNLVSRSQSPPQSLDVAEVKLPEGATTAQVNTRWNLGTTPPSAYTITFVVQKEAGGWVVDDSYCLNDPTTSIYQPPTGPCPTITTEAPGMPQTGAGREASAPLWIFEGLALVALGGLLIRRNQRTVG